MSEPRSGWIGRTSGPSDLAGALAERGLAALAIVRAAGWAALAARETDLPGLISAVRDSGESASLVAMDRVLRVEIAADGLCWFTTDGPLADALALLSEPRDKSPR